MSLIPLWFIISFIAGIASNGFHIIGRYLMKNNHDATAYTVYIQFVRFFIFGIIALFDWKLIINPSSLIIFALVGITEIFSSYYTTKMHVYSQLSISTIISRTRMIWIPILAFFIIGEQLSLAAYIGIIILFLGVGIVSSPKKFFIDKGAQYASIAAFTIALNTVFAKMAVPYTSVSVLMLIYCIPTLLVLPLFMKNARKRLRASLQENFMLQTFAVLINTAAMYLFLLALQFGEISKINAVYQGMLIFSVLAGIIFFKERENLVKKIVGTAITLVGVLILSVT